MSAASKVQAAFGVKPKRPYLQVRNELEAARKLFQELFAEHDEIRTKAQRYEKFREDKARYRQAAVNAGVIMHDDDFNPVYAIPPKMTVPVALQEKFHKQHYVVAELAEEEASYSATEKGRAFAGRPEPEAVSADA